MTDEPILWAHLMAKAGQPTAGVLVERSYIGQAYLENFRRAAQFEGIQIVAEEAIAQTGQDISAAVAALHEAGAERDRALRLRARRRRDQRRARGARLGSAALHGHRVRDRLQRAPVGRVPRVDRARAVRRGEPGRAGVPRPSTKRSTATDPSTTARCSGATARWRCSYAFADAAPLSPLGVKDALERVKMLPAACGSPGHADLVRPVDAPRLGGCRLPGRPRARSRRQGARASTGSRRSSVATARTDRRGRSPLPLSAAEARSAVRC